jgi:hypothetical protein
LTFPEGDSGFQLKTAGHDRWPRTAVNRGAHLRGRSMSAMSAMTAMTAAVQVSFAGTALRWIIGYWLSL